MTGEARRGRHRRARRAGRRHRRDAGRPPRYIPFALPGERVRVDRRGDARAPAGLPAPSAEQPFCRHFGTCGGCVAQHMSEPSLRRLEARHRRRGFAPARHRCLEVGPLQRVAPGSRRRAVLTARREQREHRPRLPSAAAATTCSTVEECPVLVPGHRGSGCRACAPSPSSCRRRESRLTVLATPVGLDVSVEGKPAQPRAKTAAAMARIAADHRFARIYVERRDDHRAGDPRARTSAASASSRRPAPSCRPWQRPRTAMVDCVLDRCRQGPSASPISSAALARSPCRWPARRVLAVDGDQAALARSAAAARHAQRLKPIEAQRARPVPRAALAARACGPSTPSCSIPRAPAPRRSARRSPSRRYRASSTCPAIRPPWRATPACCSTAATARPGHAHRPVPVHGARRTGRGVHALMPR